MSGNNLDYVRRVLRLLADHDVHGWLFGGWAEELHGLIAPRPHKDIDLLYPANDFRTVDDFLSHGYVDEITAKRLPHKRAFELDGIMTELFLVQQDEAGYYTNFWGDQRYDWPTDLFGHAQGLPVASPAAPTGFRAKFQDLSPRINGTVVSFEEWTRVNGSGSGPVR